MLSLETNWTYPKIESGELERGLKQLRAHISFDENLGFSQQLSPVCNSNSRGSNAPFWPLWALAFLKTYAA